MVEFGENFSYVFAVVVPRGDDGMGLLGEDGLGF